MLLAAFIVAFTFSDGARAKRDWSPRAYCALVLPPSQVARQAELDAVYCKGLDTINGARLTSAGLSSRSQYRAIDPPHPAPAGFLFGIVLYAKY